MRRSSILAVLIAAIVCISGATIAPAQQNQVAAVQQNVRMKMCRELGGARPIVNFDGRVDYRPVTSWTSQLYGTGTYQRSYGDTGTPFSYSATIDRFGAIRNVSYNLTSSFPMPSTYGNPAVRRVQDAIAQRLETEQNASCRFNTDVRSFNRNSRETQVSGSGVAIRQGRQIPFSYNGVYHTRSERIDPLSYTMNDTRPTPQPTPPAQREPDRVVDSNRVNYTYACNGNAFTLNGDSCTITIAGNASRVRINGSHNKIRIEARTPSVVITGNDNFVRWSAKGNPSAPEVINTGRANDIGSF